MTKMEKLEQSVAALSDAELTVFGRWFDELRWQRWDRQIEMDAENGKLDSLIAEVRADIAASKSTPL